VSLNALRSITSPSLLSLGVLLAALPSRAADDEAAAADETSAEQADAAEGAKDEAGGEDEAKATESEAEKPEQKSDEKGGGLGHAGQFGLRAGLVGGLRMIVRYEKSTYCRAFDPLKAPADQQRFCGHLAPFSLDFGLSFGVADFFEPFVWGRFGLGAEEQTDTNPIVVIGAGARLYTMSDSLVKVFIEPAVALEFEDGQGNAPWASVEDAYPTDLVFHLAAGPQFDVSRNFGVYVTGGVTTGVIRSIHTSLDLQVGVQGRYP
jgi:opacity protein-like surface antigen